VIRQRAGILKDNIVKWGTTNTVVTNNDPAHFAKLENYFDVIVIDAPCSGSGLFRRDADAMDEWSENNVQLCWQRQQRILADVWPALKENGILIYSTCSYSREEDEDIIAWLLKQVKAETCAISIDPSWGIVQVGNEERGIGYRFWPDKVKGEGFFMACCRKKEGDEAAAIRIKNKPASLTKKEMDFVEQWAKPERISFIKHENTVYAWPSLLVDDMSFLLEKLRVIYSGVLVGQLVHDKLVPDHALAMSPLILEKIVKTELDDEQAIKYLQRKEFMVGGAAKGWQLVTYRGYPLGWINVLQNRLNNYYPKEMRILKDN
jgi:NOL1/NOP2/fmu family ribosome biogenesis protein